MMASAKCGISPSGISQNLLHELTTGARFVLTSTEDVKTRQAKEAVDVKAEIANLEKKLHYLETTYKNSQQHIETLFKNGG